MTLFSSQANPSQHNERLVDSEEEERKKEEKKRNGARSMMGKDISHSQTKQAAFDSKHGAFHQATHTVQHGGQIENS